MALDMQTIFNEMLTTMGHLPFPATKIDVLNAARQARASQEIRSVIAKLPEHVRFKSPQEVLALLQMGDV